MTRPILLNVVGIPVRVGPLWLVVTVVLAAITASSFAPAGATPAEAVEWYVVCGVVAFACVLSLVAHELSHAWVAGRIGGQVRLIEPSMFGALSDGAYPPDTPGSDAKVAAAGPAISVALGVALGLAWLVVRDWGRLVSLSLGFVAIMNLTIGFANLLPAFPFDGGRMLRAFVWFLTGDLLSGARFAAVYGNFIALIGLVTGVVLVSLGVPLSVWGAWTVLGFWAVNRAGRDSYSRTMWREASKTMTIDEAGLANSSRVSARRTIDDAIDDVLHGIAGGPMLVANPDRQIVGIVSLAQIRRVPRARWPEFDIGDVSLPLDGLPVAPADETIFDLLRRFETTGSPLIVVETHGRITGVIDIDTTHARVRARMNEERADRRRRKT
jgi:Zn-dependent protease